jgi:predicted transcriptional regulator
MMTQRYGTEILSKLLKRRKIVTTAELKQALGTNSDATVFRKLNQLSARSSFSHRGRYHTLDDVAQFDDWGLWSFRDVHFSKYGTLLNTAQTLVENSEAGYFANELANLLQVSVKDALLELTRKGLLTRDRSWGPYLYCAADPKIQKHQLRLRRRSEERCEWIGQPNPDGLVPDELQAAILLFYSLLDEQQRRLYAGLEALKWGYGGDRKMARLLGLDAATVAKGRQQLLRGEVLGDRIRKPGAGRPRVEKKRPR